MRQFIIWALDGTIASGVAGPTDVWAAANSIWAYQNKGKAEPLFEWRIESPDGKPVRTRSGITLNVDGPINPRTRADAILLPGIFFSGGMTEFQRKIDHVRPLLPTLRRLHERGVVLAANCSSSFLLAEAGLLDGRPATTHWILAKQFQQRYPQVKFQPQEVITEADGILCSGAATTYLNLALRLVELFAGPSIAATTAKMLLIDSNRVSQASYRMITVQDQQPHTDDLVGRAQRWMEKRMQRSFRLRELAGDLATSERTLIRRFKQALGDTPIGYLQSLRVEFAKRLLETTKLSIDAVSERVGYGDLSSFRRLFKRTTGLSPREYHQRFARRRAVSPGSAGTVARAAI
jgi:transcriptional regulator GlxA family with amidase domain